MDLALYKNLSKAVFSCDSAQVASESLWTNIIADTKNLCRRTAQVQIREAKVKQVFLPNACTLRPVS